VLTLDRHETFDSVLAHTNRPVQQRGTATQACYDCAGPGDPQAERDDLVARNVAALVKPPKGQGAGRPSKSLTLEQAVALMAAARGTRLEAYITLSLLTDLRTEEVRALRWDHVVAWGRANGRR